MDNERGKAKSELTAIVKLQQEARERGLCWNCLYEYNWAVKEGTTPKDVQKIVTLPRGTRGSSGTVHAVYACPRCDGDTVKFANRI